MTSKITRVFLVGLVLGLVGSTAGVADAWFRTAPASNGFLPVGGPGLTIPFPSDGTSGTPNGNSTTTVYADFYIVGLSSGQSQSVRMIACGQAFNATVLFCGAPIINTYTANGAYDASVPKWSGTGSPWDYFTVLVTNWDGPGTVYATGIGVIGT
jgi:hypothetical protein